MKDNIINKINSLLILIIFSPIVLIIFAISIFTFLIFFIVMILIGICIAIKEKKGLSRFR
jgi:hypothetical protein